MDRFRADELRALQILAESLAVWIDYHDPDPDAKPEDVVTHRKASQRMIALSNTARLLGGEKVIRSALHQLEEYVH